YDDFKTKTTFLGRWMKTQGEDEQRTDLELMVRIQAGDQDAFAILYNRYAPRVLGLTRRIIFDDRESEDVMQIVFLNIWQRCHAYKPERGSVEAYIFQIAKSRIIDALRQKRRVVTEVSSTFLDEPAPSEDEMAKIDALLTARQLIQPLSSQERQAIILTVYGGFSQREIAQMLRKPLGSVKSWIHRGLHKLRTALETHQETERREPRGPFN
ncbi:MAG: hypothetical protein C7B44_13855, partial [Sulfobacillus thermosulfidooxidans]